MSALAATEPARRAALEKSAEALRRMAGYTLPPAIDRRLLDLGERKDELSADEREELLAWAAFSQERSIEKFKALAALRELIEAYPELG